MTFSSLLPSKKNGTWSLTKQASYDVISRKVEVLDDVVEDTGECADAQRGVFGNRNVMLSALCRGQARMLPV